MIVTLIQILLFTFYVGYIWFKIGIQKSISESYYNLKEAKWMFSIIPCFGIGILQLTHGGIYFYLSGAFLCFTGAASEYKNWHISKIVHYIGAIGGILFSIVALWINYVEWVFAPIAIVGLFCWQAKIPNKIWWIEIVAFYSIMLGLLEIYKYQ